MDNEKNDKNFLKDLFDNIPLYNRARVTMEMLFIDVVSEFDPDLLKNDVNDSPRAHRLGKILRKRVSDLKTEFDEYDITRKENKTGGTTD